MCLLAILQEYSPVEYVYDVRFTSFIMYTTSDKNVLNLPQTSEALFSGPVQTSDNFVDMWLYRLVVIKKNSKITDMSGWCDVVKPILMLRKSEVDAVGERSRTKAGPSCWYWADVYWPASMQIHSFARRKTRTVDLSVVSMYRCWRRPCVLISENRSAAYTS